MNTNTLDDGLDLSTAEGVSELEARVRCRAGKYVHDFYLDVTDCGVVLHGRARTYYAKQLAQHAVMEASELPILANEIKVY